MAKKQEFLNVQSIKDGKKLEVTTSLVLRLKVTVDTLLRELKKSRGIKSLSINPARFELEY